jgi:prevent-host-death family protein
MSLTASKLRENIYRILDQVLETGVPVEIRRKGRTVRIVPAVPPSKLERLKQRDYLTCDPDSIVHLDWSGEWRP